MKIEDLLIEVLFFSSIPLAIAAWMKISSPLWLSLPPWMLILFCVGLLAVGGLLYQRNRPSIGQSVAFVIGLVVALMRF